MSAGNGKPAALLGKRVVRDIVEIGRLREAKKLAGHRRPRASA
jgi:hypothetical protein